VHLNCYTQICLSSQPSKTCSPGHYGHKNSLQKGNAITPHFVPFSISYDRKSRLKLKARSHHWDSCRINQNDFTSSDRINPHRPGLFQWIKKLSTPSGLFACENQNSATFNSLYILNQMSFRVNLLYFSLEQIIPFSLLFTEKQVRLLSHFPPFQFPSTCDVTTVNVYSFIPRIIRVLTKHDTVLLEQVHRYHCEE
jgi:hypothetical protein